jgi:putative phosphoesterase
MRIAVISDIHGNCLALDAVLADIRQHAIEQIVCLGDAIQGGAQPAETVQHLRALNCPIVMGNADAWLLTGQETSDHEQVSESQLATRIWSLAQLSEEDKAWIASFSPTIEIALEAGKKLLCFHGSPHSFDDILLPDTSEEEFQRVLGGFDATLLCGGHTHTQQWRRLDNDAWYFNPGSVGLAYNWRLPDEQFQADPWADYAIVTSEGERIGVEFRHVPFDVEALIDVIRKSGKPDIERAIHFYRQV